MECDIEVPEYLNSYFEVMTLVFKNTEVNLEDDEEFMEKFAKDNNLGEAPQRVPIGSYFGKEICLATPLIQWYLNHGLVITKICKVVEYTPKAAFKDFSVDWQRHLLQGLR